MSEHTPVPISDFPAYGVTAEGRVVNLAKGNVLATWADRKNGYLWVSLSRPGTRKRFARSVHTLVALAYHGPKPSPQHVCRHLNGNRLDNRAENLAWGTSSENAADTARHGRANWLRTGIERPGTRLTDEEALEISERANRGESLHDIADAFGITTRYVRDLRDHKRRLYLWQSVA